MPKHPPKAGRRPMLFLSFMGLLLMAALYCGHAFLIVFKHEEPQRRRATATTEAVVTDAAAAAAASLGLLEPMDEAPEAAAAAAAEAGLGAEPEAAAKESHAAEQLTLHAVDQLPLKIRWWRATLPSRFAQLVKL